MAILPVWSFMLSRYRWLSLKPLLGQGLLGFAKIKHERLHPNPNCTSPGYTRSVRGTNYLSWLCFQDAFRMVSRCFQDGYGEHVITEYWHAQERRWVLLDVQLDELQCEVVQIPFDPCDVPRVVYLTANVAWQRYQNKEIDPMNFGFLPEYTGLWYVKAHLARDIATLNKIKMLCWDYWSIFERRDIDMSDGDIKLLDQAAKLSLAGNRALSELPFFILAGYALTRSPYCENLVCGR